MGEGIPAIRLLGHEAPLEARRETGTTTATEAGDLDLIDDPVAALVEDVLGAVPVTLRGGEE